MEGVDYSQRFFEDSNLVKSCLVSTTRSPTAV